MSHRSALEYKPTEAGEIFLTGSTNRRINYPGLTLVFIRGPKALSSDPSFLKMRTSSPARAYLENLSGTKRTQDRCLKQSEIEERFEAVLQSKGEDEFNHIRDQAKIVAHELHWESELKRLTKLFGAILGSRSSKFLKSDLAIARAGSLPFDPTRIEKFDLLFGELMRLTPQATLEHFQNSLHHRNKAFFEAYFSNYIEGTTFEVEEAEQIIFQHKIPKDRPQDSHDILGTFQLVSDFSEMKKVPKTFKELESLIQSRHQVLMSSRTESLPGKYKTKPNRAGITEFPKPELVRGTLLKGFERYLHLPEGISRAIYMMFLIAEVHPFMDGNGRIARIMMNTELISQRQGTIIIPTVYRDDYLLSLRALTRMNRPNPIVRCLVKAQKFSFLNFQNYSQALKHIQDHNWFCDPDDGKIIELLNSINHSGSFTQTTGNVLASGASKKS